MSEDGRRDYLERTIATVRNHRSADNCWPQWANIFADEIERLWEVEAENAALSEYAEELREALVELDHILPRLPAYAGRVSRVLKEALALPIPRGKL